jgi:hypothetical protein
LSNSLLRLSLPPNLSCWSEKMAKHTGGCIPEELSQSWSSMIQGAL